MQFALPENLKVALVPYDPTLKTELRKAKQPNSNRKSNPFPIGNVCNLIPFHIVSEAKQKLVVAAMNQKEACDRSIIFYAQNKNGTENREKVAAILYHHKSVWVACWLPVKGEDYFYGFSIAIRKGVAFDRAATEYRIAENHSCLVFHQEKFDRSTFLVARHKVTLAAISNDIFTSSYWNFTGAVSYHKRSAIIYRQIQVFFNYLQRTFPTWEDGNSVWERVSPKTNKLSKIIANEAIFKNFEQLDLTPFDEGETIHHSLMLKALENYGFSFKTSRITGAGHLITNHVGNKLPLNVLSTPFFKKWIQNQLNLVVDKYKDPDVKRKSEICAGIHRIVHVFFHVKSILRIWPDTPIDHFQTNLDIFMSLEESIIPSYGNMDLAVEWLNKTMPVESFFTCLRKYYNNCKEQRENGHNFWQGHTATRLGVFMYPSFFAMRDSVSMLQAILKEGKTIDPPRRWRIEEFHDHVQGEAWKIKNPNQLLPQDLFPHPIKIEYNGETWTFFQPIDTHQLSSWGQAVRNCVGSSSTYAEGVKKKQHFLVLCMVDKKPRFTIQLKVDGGIMSVNQITDLSNKSLTSEQKEDYSYVFSKALTAREKSLTAQS